jgi:hypothetical protein
MHQDSLFDSAGRRRSHDGADEKLFILLCGIVLTIRTRGLISHLRRTHAEVVASDG